MRRVSMGVVSAIAAMALFGGVSQASAAYFETNNPGGATILDNLGETIVFEFQKDEITCEELYATTVAPGGGDPKDPWTTLNFKYGLYWGENGCTSQKHLKGYVAAVDSKGCAIEYHPDGSFDLESCVNGLRFDMSIGFLGHCTIEFPNQSVSTDVTYENDGKSLWINQDLEMTANLVVDKGVCPYGVKAGNKARWEMRARVDVIGGFLSWFE